MVGESLVNDSPPSTTAHSSPVIWLLAGLGRNSTAAGRAGSVSYKGGSGNVGGNTSRCRLDTTPDRRIRQMHCRAANARIRVAARHGGAIESLLPRHVHRAMEGHETAPEAPALTGGAFLCVGFPSAPADSIGMRLAADVVSDRQAFLLGTESSAQGSSPAVRRISSTPCAQFTRYNLAPL